MKSQARILVVDDEKTLRDILSRALERRGHRCTEAANGEEALELVSKQAFDLVMTDLKMPKVDGLALIEWLRESRPTVPIIIMTGYADLDSARKALRLRVSDYLVKPFESLAEVQAAVERALSDGGQRSDTQVLVREFEERAREFERRELSLAQTLDCARLEIDALHDRLAKSETVSSLQASQVEELVSQLDSGMLVTDVQGLVVSTNQEMRDLLGAPSFRGSGVPVERLPGDSSLREGIAESLSRLRAGLEAPVAVDMSDGEGSDPAYEVRSRWIASGDGKGPMGIVTVVRPARLKVAAG
jgi:CheY-like chemotaxis protein